MSAETRNERFRQQAERSIDAAALRVARSVQAPGQSPEQTKLVAQGIAKGIALYRKQQNEKIRERDRQRKRALKQRERSVSDEPGDLSSVPGAGVFAGAPITILWIVGVVFAAASVLHVLRFVFSVSVLIGGWAMPIWWPLPGCVLAAVLAEACSWGGRKQRVSSSE